MTIRYNGNRINYNPHTRTSSRTAVIIYDDGNNADCQATEYILKVLEINGWPVRPIGVENIFEIDVSDREEYEDLVACYKDAKKGAKLNAKHFPKVSRLYFPEN